MVTSGSCLSPTLGVLVSRCQVLAGRFTDSSPSDLLDDIARVAADVPLEGLAARERMIVAMVLVRLLSRWVAGSALATPGPIMERLVELGTAPPAPTLWRQQWTAVLDRCRRALPLPVEPPARRRNPRSQVLREAIRLRFRESNLRLSDVAHAARVSPCHAARLLARDTGKGFVAHVRDHRVTEARQLLGQTLLSVKEIAAAAGYASGRQLTRDFRRLCGTTPLAFRSRERA